MPSALSKLGLLPRAPPPLAPSTGAYTACTALRTAQLLFLHTSFATPPGSTAQLCGRGGPEHRRAAGACAEPAAGASHRHSARGLAAGGQERGRSSGDALAAGAALQPFCHGLLPCGRHLHAVRAQAALQLVSKEAVGQLGVLQGAGCEGGGQVVQMGWCGEASFNTFTTREGADAARVLSSRRVSRYRAK